MTFELAEISWLSCLTVAKQSRTWNGLRQEKYWLSVTASGIYKNVKHITSSPDRWYRKWNVSDKQQGIWSNAGKYYSLLEIWSTFAE